MLLVSSEGMFGRIGIDDLYCELPSHPKRAIHKYLVQD